MSRALLWFRNDLRLADHPALHALASSATTETLLPLFVFPDRLFGTTSYGFAKTGPFRAAFLVESVERLRASLRALGSDLVVVRGDPGRVVAALAARFDLDVVHFQDEPGTEEADEVASARSRSAATLVPHHAATLYHPDDLPFPRDDIPLVFSDFRRALERSSHVRDPLPAPGSLPPLPAPAEAVEAVAVESGARAGVPDVEELAGRPLPEPDSRSPMTYRGGEAAALERLHGWAWERDRLRHYRRTRNGLIGADYSSRLSPWLANGSISPRTIHASVKRYETERKKNDSTYWLIFELVWRDYFACLARTFPREIFLLDGPMRRSLRWRDEDDAFERWRTGTTGQPFIDANMREIAATGFMSNRGRQNVASYLARDLRVPWLRGAEYFESLLIDYDPASNYGNWTYTVGVGTDPRRDRYFNAERQAEKYDAAGRYREIWLGERAG